MSICGCAGSGGSKIKLRLSLLFGSGLRRNIASAGLQSIVAMFAVFGTYRIVINAVGIEVFGLWSVLLAGAAIARVADVGGGSGLARFVAECDAGKRPTIGAVAFVHTTFLSTLALMLAGSGLLYLLAPPLIRYFAPQAADQVIGLVPVALLVSVILPAVSALMCSALDGTRRVDLRAALMSASYIVLLGSTWALVGRYGIHGFAMALATQHLFLIVSTWLVLRRVMPNLGWLPRRWSSPAFRESFGFGLKVQATAFASLLSDPVARLLIVSAGGVEAAGHYELALRFMQTRVIFGAAMQPLVPQVASLSHDPQKIAALMERSVRLASLAGLIFTATIVIFAPLYASIMVASYTPEIAIYCIILGAGNGVNLISVPLFFGATARGMMKWNLWSRLVNTAGTAAFGAIGMLTLGATGVVLGQMSALLIGTGVVIIGNANILGVGNYLRQSIPYLVGCVAMILLFSVAGIWWVLGSS